MTVWNAIYRAAMGVLALFALIAVGYAYYNPLKERDHLLSKKMELEEVVKQQQERLDDLKQRQERLQTDARFVEKLAREEFGYAKPGEVVFKFEGDVKPAQRKN